MSEPSSGAGAVEVGPATVTASVVVPVHNKAVITGQCLDLLLAEPAGDVSREIVVVDDGSRDRTPELLAGYGERIRVVRHDAAAGFAGACNDGAAAAAGEFVVFLNNDTLPRPGWLEAMVGHARAHPGTGAVGAKLLFPNDTIQHAGVVFGFDRHPHHIYAGLPADLPAAQVSRRYQAVTGACLLVPRSVWQEFGGFDRAFVNGWEDVDFCLRLGEAGYAVRYCADAVVYHLESASRDLRAPQERANREEYFRRWGGKVVPDDFGFFHADGLMQVTYPARYPIRVGFSPLVAGVAVGDNERRADALLHERARQTTILLRNNIVLNVRVQDAEQRAAAAEQRAAAAEQRAREAEERALAAERRRSAAPAPAPAAGPRVGADGRYPIVGRVESPMRNPGVVTDPILPILGWAASGAGIRSVETFVDGEHRATMEYGESRPDAIALFPDLAGHEACGFAGVVPMHDLADGVHELEIRISANDGKVAPIKTTFEIDATAVASGRVLMRLDKPAAGSRFTPRDRLLISGWALSPAGIDRVELELDGQPAGDLAYGALRPDVARLYAFFDGANHSGFVGSFRAADLEPGDHTLTVRPVGGDGQSAETVVPFAVEAAAIPGEVPHLTARYPEWLARNAPDGDRLGQLRAQAAALPAPPRVDLIVPIVAGDPAAALPAMDSVRAQVYDAWRLLVPVAAAIADEARSRIGDAAADPRVVVSVHDGNPGFADLANAALATSTADWVAVLPAADRLAPQALAEIALDLQAHPETDIVYPDEDKLDPETGQRWDPFFKPDWSPELHLSRPYVGPAAFYRRSLLARVGGWRPEFAGAEDYDLALRATERTGRIRHLPLVLLSRQAAMAEADRPDPATRAAEARALTAAVARRGLAATVVPGNHRQTWRVRRAIEGTPGVTVVMPTGGKMQFLRPCLDDLLHRTTWPNLRVLVLDNSAGDEVAALIDDLAAAHPEKPLRRVRVELAPFNFSALINAAIPHLETPYALLLNDDISVVTPDWVEAMLEHAQDPGVGVVGAKLLYPDGTIQHAGVLLGPYQGTGHAFKFFPDDDPRYFGLPDAVRNCLGVTFACALLKTDLLRTLNGLDAERLPIAFNDVDFCLRAVEAGYRNVYTPHAVLVHHESVTKTTFAHPREIGYLRTRWKRFIDHDPFYNPNLTRAGEDAGLRLE